MVNAANFNNQANPEKESSPKKVTLKELALRSWLDLPERLIELDNLVAPIVDDLIYVRKKQIQIASRISRTERNLLPEGGDPFERLDWDAYLRLREKLATKQPVDPSDFEVWKEDEFYAEPTTVQTFILGDGSVSGGYNLPNGGGKRINTGLQAMATFREGAKGALFDAYAGMFGRNGIKMLAAPGDSDEKVGKNFEDARKCDFATSNLAPSVREAVEILAAPDTREQDAAAQQVVRQQYAGMTHFVIIGDGGMGEIEDGGAADVKATAKILITLFRLECGISVDIAVLSNDKNTNMHKLVEAVKAECPMAAINLVNCVDPNQIPGLLADMLKERFSESLEGVQGVPDAVKREKFQAALDMLDQPAQAKPAVRKSGTSLRR